MPMGLPQFLSLVLTPLHALAALTATIYLAEDPGPLWEEFALEQ